MGNPRIQIEKSNSDKLIEWAGWICVILSWTFVIRGYARLPETIAVHFDWQGKADSYGSKKTLFILPAIGSALYIGLLSLSRYPHLFNYVQTITTDNAESLYRLAARTLRITNLVAIAGITYLCRVITLPPDIGSNEPGPWFIILFMTGMTAPVIYLLAKSPGKKKPPIT